MLNFDSSQVRALELKFTEHARVLGAPGSGKTRVLVAACIRAFGQPGWDEDDVLVLAPNRQVSAQLRKAIERESKRVFGGTPVRTAASLGFALLSRMTALAGETAPRLLTGTVHDEAIADTITEMHLAGRSFGAGLVPDIVQSPTFRAELRELWRVLDDADLSTEQLSRELSRVGAAASQAAYSEAPPLELTERWLECLGIIEAVTTTLSAERPGELSSSAMLAAATRAVRAEGAVGNARLRVPRLILVDDAQELGEGEVALLAACSGAGSRIWAFGDPDISTGAFQGEPARVLSELTDELARRGAGMVSGALDQVVTLDTVYRHGSNTRGFVQSLTARIGTSGTGAHRAALAADGASSSDTNASNDADASNDPDTTSTVEFVSVSTPAEQLGVIAHRLRARKLGVGGTAPIGWAEMAVICRTRAEANHAARVLAAHQVPTGISSGGIVLREHQIVRELIRMLQHALGIHSCGASDVLELVSGVIGGLDPVAVRRLRGALLVQERRDAQDENREPNRTDELIAEAFEFPGQSPVIDSSGGRALRRLGLIAAEATRVVASGGTPRETLWKIWDGTHLAERWQDVALDARGARADEAHRSLDAVLGLFFALQRHEEQDSEQPIEDLLEDLLESTVPEDSLAQRSQRDAVTVTTPQGAIGREFDVVSIVGLQDGSWPNLRARGSLLGATALERWLRGGLASAPSRRDTIHDELRLFVQSCSRARRELLVVAVSEDEHHPSAFFGFGRDHLVETLPSSRLTLRGVTAQMRRTLTLDPENKVALRSLTALSSDDVPGAHPDEWYGALAPSTEAPLVDLDGDPETRVSVSPSQLERAEACPLDWIVSSLGGGGSSTQASLGTLVHHALETADGSDPEALYATVIAEWDKLHFDAEWESVRTQRLARSMVDGVAAYLREFEGSDRVLVGTEAKFQIPIDRVILRGVADRLETRTTIEGTSEVTVLDLKTGRTPPSKQATEEHAQLQAYQLGVVFGAFHLSEAQGDRDAAAPQEASGATSGGARLLYVHPDAAKRSSFVERAQSPITPEAIETFTERVSSAARVFAAGEFTARVEHHCSDPHKPGSCRLHVIQAVSHA